MPVAACLTSSESTEYYTPAMIITAARKVMGRIDVDPASNPIANQIVQATIYYTKETNGFNKRWDIHGKPAKVWLNPPYGFDDKKPNQARWSAKLIEQFQAGIVDEAILLVNSKTGDKWFKPLKQYPMCLPDFRINFYTPDGALASGSTHGSALVYFGTNLDKFIEVFSEFGPVMGCLSNRSYRSLWSLESVVA